MSIAWKELLRQPRRFLPVGGALTLLVVLLAVLGGFLDGLELSQTGAYRAQEPNLLVFDEGADRQIQRSRLDPREGDALGAVDGIAAVGGLDQSFVVIRTAGGELVDVALFGYELGTDRLPEPPPSGSAVVDAQLGRVAGVAVGDTIEVGARAEPLEVTAVVDDVSLGAPTVWVGVDDWRQLVGSTNPAALGPEGTHQLLVVRPADDSTVDLAALTERLSDAAPVDAVTVNEAIQALDVVQQQSSTFTGIIGVTFVVTLVVVALFFALITLERIGLYAMLKALGGTTAELLRGLALQAFLVSAAALVIGLAAAFAFTSLLPPELPIRLEPFRLSQIAVGTVVTSVVGSLLTARRILRVDPAEAIG